MNCSRKHLALRVRNHAHFVHNVHVDTFSRIRKQESKIIEYSKSGLVSKRKVCSVHSQAFKNTMGEWVWDMFAKETNISDSLIQANKTNFTNSQ